MNSKLGNFTFYLQFKWTFYLLYFLIFLWSSTTRKLCIRWEISDLPCPGPDQVEQLNTRYSSLLSVSQRIKYQHQARIRSAAPPLCMLAIRKIDLPGLRDGWALPTPDLVLSTKAVAELWGSAWLIDSWWRMGWELLQLHRQLSSYMVTCSHWWQSAL